MFEEPLIRCQPHVVRDVLINLHEICPEVLFVVRTGDAIFAVSEEQFTQVFVRVARQTAKDLELQARRPKHEVKSFDAIVRAMQAASEEAPAGDGARRRVNAILKRAKLTADEFAAELEARHSAK